MASVRKAYSWWICQATHNRLQIEINYYPDSLLFISAGFLPRVSSQRLNWSYSWPQNRNEDDRTEHYSCSSRCRPDCLSKRSLPTDCQRDEKILRTILPKAASHHIPTGRHRLHEEPVPAWVLDVMTRRDDLCKRDRTSPELLRLNKDIQKCICEHKRQKWRYIVENLDHKTDITKLWRTIKGIDGRAKRTAENEAISFIGISLSSSKQLEKNN